MNNIVFITGVSRGIGLEIAKAFTVNNYYVIGTSRKAFDLKKAIDSDKCLHLELDVKDRIGISEAVTKLKVDDLMPSIVINNAGITKDQIMLRMKDEEWDDVVGTNLGSVYRLSKAVLRGMTKARWGRIINISSVVAGMGNAGQSNYAASKAGMEGFTRALAREVGSRAITVNAVAPGFIDTDMTKALNEGQRSAMLEQIPLGRLGQAEEIAAVVEFLTGESAGYITGAVIPVNGGMFMS